MKSEAQTSEEATTASPEAPKTGRQLRFINVFLLAVLALFIPLTVLTSQTNQDLRQQAQTPQSVMVEILDTGFNPPSVTVQVGQTVTWVNHGSSPHTSSSDMGGTPDSWDSTAIGSAQIFSQTFANPGTFPYHDNLNPQLRGTVIVQQGMDASAMPSPSEMVVPSPNCLGGVCASPTQPPSGPTQSTISESPSPSVPAEPTTPDVSQSPTIPVGGPSDVPSAAPSEEVPSAAPSEEIEPSEPAEPTEIKEATVTPPAPGGGGGQNNNPLIALLLLIIAFLLRLIGLKLD